MASNKIELDIGGKYSAGQMFKQLDTDIKTAGKSMKDMGQGAMTVANGIAGAMGEKVNGTLKSTIGIVGEMARGGIWGAMATAATAAIGYIADKIKEAKEQAKELTAAFAEMMGGKYKDSFTAISDQLKTTKQDMADTTKEADNMLKALNGKVADSAKVQIAQLHVETLQKMTDATSEAAKKAIEAQEAYIATVWKNNATMDQANNELNAANTKRSAALTRYNATEEALEATKEQQRKLETVYSSQLQRRSDLQANIERWTIESSLSEEKAKENADRLAWAREKLAELEEQNKEVFAQHAAGLQQINALETELATSDIELTNANRAVTAATRNIEVVKNESAASEAEAKLKRDAANLALEQETQATEAATKQKEEEAKLQLFIDKIKADAVEKDIEYAEYVELATKALKEGYSEQTALNLVRARYRQSLEEAAKAQEEETSNNKKGASKSSHSDLISAIKEGIGGTTVNTKVDTSGVGSGVDQSNKVLTLGNLQREVRDDQREMRNKTDLINQSSAAMQAYLKGQMSPEVAAKFQEKLKAMGITKQDLSSMTEKALKAQLLSHSQALEQQKAVIDIQKKLEKMGLK